MVAEGDPKHVVHFPLDPIGRAPQWNDGVHNEVAVLRQFDLDTEFGKRVERTKLVHHFERALVIPVLHCRHID